MTDHSYLTVQDVAKWFGVNPTTIYHLVQRGALPGFKVGHQWRFSQAMLELWVADQVHLDGLRTGGPKP